MSERRQSVRIPSDLPSFVRDLQSDAYIDCTVIDISETGARVSVARPLECGNSIELHIPAKGQVFQASIVWCRGNEIGTSFESVYDLERTASALLRFAAQLS
jgi:hypothetical protein